MLRLGFLYSRGGAFGQIEFRHPLRQIKRSLLEQSKNMKLLLKERAKRFYGNQHVKRWIRNPFTKYVVNPTVKATKVTVFLIAAAYIFILVGHILNSVYLEDKAEASVNATSTPAMATSTIKQTYHEIYENYPFPPFLEKISKAESGGKHLVNGQININETRDVGVCQINLYWQAKRATELGYNLADEQDNREYALYLFLTEGEAPWKASKHVWSKK
jgi:hypothetical protein